MRQLVLATIMGMSVTASAYAQVAPDATGGRSGGPNQSQAVVPPGTTGGRSGGPNQSGFTKKAPSKKQHKTKH